MSFDIRRLSAVLAAAAFSVCLMASATSANSVSAVSVEPTFESAGIIVTLSGTDDPGAATLEVKEVGEAEFRRAHDFVRYDNHHLASSLFDLKPGTSYDVRVTAGGQSTTASFTTRPEFALPAPLRTVPVSSSAQLLAAIADARPGDEILLSPGTYGGGFTVIASGTAEHPIVIRGNIPAAEKARPADQRQGLPVINGAGKSPVISVRGSHIVLDGLRLENVSLIGISLEVSGRNVVQGCQVTGARSGWNHFIYVNGGGAAGGRHLIQDNYLQDTGSGVGYGILQDRNPGPGTVIRRNILTGFYDGINPSGNEGELNDENLPETHADVLGRWPNHSTDVYENVIRISRDDDIEMDGIAVNMRVFRNLLSAGAGNHATNALSIAPVAPGPFFFVRNVLTNFYEGAVKYNTASYRGTIRNCFFYHNTIKNDEGAARRGTLLTLWEGTGLPGTRSKNTYFKNNIFVGDKMLIQRLVDYHTPEYNPNYWYSRQSSGTLYQWLANGPYYASFDAWRAATGQETGGFYGDPKVDASFRLASGSPPVDRGILIAGINDGYTGKAPDMGAFESGIVPGNVAENFPPVPAYSISGYVKDDLSVPIPGVQVLLSGDRTMSAVSGPDGFYQFTGLPEGRYTVTIVRSGFAFSPAARTVGRLSADQRNVNFTGTGTGETISGAYAFPNPWQTGLASDPFVTFRNLAQGTKIRIFTLDAQLVREITVEEGTEARWDIGGVASGVYVCALNDGQGEKKRLKVAIIK